MCVHNVEENRCCDGIDSAKHFSDEPQSMQTKAYNARLGTTAIKTRPVLKLEHDKRAVTS